MKRYLIIFLLALPKLGWASGGAGEIYRQSDRVFGDVVRDTTRLVAQKVHDECGANKLCLWSSMRETFSSYGATTGAFDNVQGLAKFRAEGGRLILGLDYQVTRLVKVGFLAGLMQMHVVNQGSVLPQDAFFNNILSGAYAHIQPERTLWGAPSGFFASSMAIWTPSTGAGSVWSQATTADISTTSASLSLRGGYDYWTGRNTSITPFVQVGFLYTYVDNPHTLPSTGDPPSIGPGPQENVAPLVLGMPLFGMAGVALHRDVFIFDSREPLSFDASFTYTSGGKNHDKHTMHGTLTTDLSSTYRIGKNVALTFSYTNTLMRAGSMAHTLALSSQINW